MSGDLVEKDYRISKPFFNKSKCREIILYIMNNFKNGKEKGLDKETLKNILYLCDFNYYEKYEEHLTGAKYLKEKK